MQSSDVTIILNSVNKQFGALQTQLTDTKNDLTKGIDEVKVEVKECVTRVTALEKSEIELKMEAETTKEGRKKKTKLWDTFIRTVTVCVVPILLMLLYSIFAIAAKLDISPF